MYLLENRLIKIVGQKQLAAQVWVGNFYVFYIDWALTSYLPIKSCKDYQISEQYVYYQNLNKVSINLYSNCQKICHQYKFQKFLISYLP